MALVKKTPNPIDRHVGGRVRMRRLLLGLSQEKLGDALEVTFQQVQKYEKGVNRIGASRLQQMAKVLETTPSYFFEGAPMADAAAHGFAEQPAPDFIVDSISTVEGIQLNRAFARIADAKVRKRVVDLVTAIAESGKDPT